MFILKGALKNEDFLAARMTMGRECAPWGVADDRGRAGDLVPLTIKHPPVHTGSRAGDPIHLACIQQDHFCQIFIDQHPDCPNKKPTLLRLAKLLISLVPER